MLQFEYNENKSISNKEKHGVDFEEAKVLFDDKNLYSYLSSYPNERRRILIGKIVEKYYTMVVTYRVDNIRIISVRRSRKKEIIDYEANKKYNR